MYRKQTASQQWSTQIARIQCITKYPIRRTIRTPYKLFLAFTWSNLKHTDVFYFIRFFYVLIPFHSRLFIVCVMSDVCLSHSTAPHDWWDCGLAWKSHRNNNEIFETITAKKRKKGWRKRKNGVLHSIRFWMGWMSTSKDEKKNLNFFVFKLFRNNK